MQRISNTVDRIALILNWVTLFCFAGIMGFIVLDVLLRTLFNQPILGSFEIVERLMFCGVFCSFAYAQSTGSHIHIAMFTSVLPKKAALILLGGGGFLSASVCFLLCWCIAQQTMLEAQKHYVTAILKIPTAPFSLVAVAGVFAFALTLLWSACKCFLALTSDKLAREVLSGELG